MERRLYLAYGEYMSLQQMAAKCATAQRVGKGYIRGWRLTFGGESGNGVENIVPCHNGIVPVAVWKVTLDDEKELDIRYKYPSMYTKLEFNVIYKNTIRSGFTYILNKQLSAAAPSQIMKDILKEGYSDTGIDVKDWNDIFF